MKNGASAPADGEPGRHVFVYGTLRKGEVNDINRLSPAPDYLGPATVAGILYSMGWYPGLVLDVGEARVVGEVYAVSAALEVRLDEIEGLLPEPTGEYFKKNIRLQVDGRAVDCFVYEIAPALIAGREPLAGGDWLLRSC